MKIKYFVIIEKVIGIFCLRKITRPKFELFGISTGNFLYEELLFL